jgi:hypothetical protein
LGELQVLSAEYFCEQDDLSGVVGKMLGNMENSTQAGDTKPLDGISPVESLSVQLPQHAVRFTDRLAQPGMESTAGDWANFLKLSVALAAVGRTT